ncbi:Sister chromatid cohesion protein pds5 [Hypsizygus marmoreus]|uniref:Sister chromatid cohesion protein pds5 n=1 Tax=Hypsizygus marmoreus TaxID=39966 RepID=A0A369K1T9_HYPMA|nr:Sister chromatid cohesion protein pds5 [Hypsizygus marmoreus]
MVAQTRHGGQSSPKKKLVFHEKLLGKGLSTDALLKKLKTLHTELAALDQELVDVNSLGSARKELVNTSILLHKDRGVKAYAACCLADILRLYAPDAPYTQAELRDIFQFFFRQLTTGLKGADSSYYNEYFHLLESLSTVKSVVLVCDLPTAEELLTEIFRDFFNLIRRDLPKKIEMFMVDILVALIDECQVLPTEVLETMLSQFMDNNTRIEQAGYRLAVQVCNATADKLQRHVCQHFTDIIVANSRDEEDFNEIRAAHELIKRLNHSCPGLLHSVIPQLEEELRVEETALRLIATQVLGEMFADKGGAELVKKYPTTWNVWVQRKNDKSALVRIKFVEATRGLIVNLFEQREVIEESLHSKLLDPDEKVRAAVCKVYGQLDYETALHHVADTQLRAVAERGADKRQSVRVEALTSLGKLYSLAYPEIENNEPLAIKQFSWIPNEILKLIGTSLEVRAVVEQILTDYILPLPSSSTPSTSKGGDVDEVAWTDRLLLTMRYLDEKSTNALLVLSNTKQVRPTVFDHFVEACIKNNGGVIDENEEQVAQRLEQLTKHIAGTFPDPFKALEDLQAFAKLNEGRLYKLMKTCMDPQTDLKGLVKATNEFQRRMEPQSTSQAATLALFLRRSSFRILNQSSIPTLIKRVQKGHGNAASPSHTAAAHAQVLLTYVSKHSPALYQSHISELTKAIADEKSATLVETCLHALAGVVQWDNKLVPTDKRTHERITRFTLQSNERHAKFAARILAASRDLEVCSGTVKTIAEELPESSEEMLVAHIAVLAQFARLVPEAFESQSDVIMAFLLKQVLMVPCLPDPNDMDVDEEWVTDEDVSPTLRAKILSLKVCRNRSLAHASPDKGLDIAAPALKMFATLLEHNGSFTGDANEDPKFMSRMRLQAAVSLLHLSTVETYANAIAPKFLRLAVTVQDSCYNVRVIFLTKLISLLQPRKLPPRYNVIPFLTVHDPESDIKAMASSYVTGALKKMRPNVRSENLEIIFIRLLHLLAHHPDFNKNHEDLLDIAKYIQFYLSLVATSETVSLLYHLAMKGKTVRDAESHTYTENLYVICELAQELIKSYASTRSWSVQSYPGKVRLPADILRPLPSPEAARKVMKTVFLPEETISWLADLSKPAHAKEKKERKVPAKRKAPPAAKANGHAKRTRVKKKWDSDDDDESEEEPSEGDSSDVVREEEPKPTSEPDEEEETEEKLGRGARTRAKARTRRQKASVKAEADE